MKQIQEQAHIFPVRIENGTKIVTVQHFQDQLFDNQVSSPEFGENFQACGPNRPNLTNTGSDVRNLHDPSVFGRRKRQAELFVNTS